MKTIGLIRQVSLGVMAENAKLENIVIRRIVYVSSTSEEGFDACRMWWSAVTAQQMGET